MIILHILYLFYIKVLLSWPRKHELFFCFLLFFGKFLWYMFFPHSDTLIDIYNCNNYCIIPDPTFTTQILPILTNHINISGTAPSNKRTTTFSRA